jgi:AcrR family transcriptional regulator
MAYNRGVAELPMIETTEPRDLPVVDSPRERADAARNRQRILDAAAQLFAEQPACDVSMDAVAAAAGVGKGTLFRRFGDRPGLLRTLLNESEVAFQEAVIRGEPPLGPGAPPAERLIAFGRGRFELLERHGAMIANAEAGEQGEARFSNPVYLFYRAHIGLLVRECDPTADAEYLTEALLAPLAGDVYQYQRDPEGRGMSFERICEGYGELVRRLLG